MHICLDYIPELLAQPQIEKQVFAIQLISHLSVQYALPKSLNSARIAVNFMNQMVSGKSTSGYRVDECFCYIYNNML